MEVGSGSDFESYCHPLAKRDIPTFQSTKYWGIVSVIFYIDTSFDPTCIHLAIPAGALHTTIIQAWVNLPIKVEADGLSLSFVVMLSYKWLAIE